MNYKINFEKQSFKSKLYKNKNLNPKELKVVIQKYEFAKKTVVF